LPNRRPLASTLVILFAAAAVATAVAFGLAASTRTARAQGQDIFYLPPGPCPQATTHVTGTIRDADGRVVPNARVLYAGDTWDDDCQYQYRFEVQALADSQGVYDMKLPWGTGKLQFYHPNLKAYPGYDTEEIHSGGGTVRRNHRFTRIWVHVTVAGPDSGGFVLGLVHCTAPSLADGREMTSSLLANECDFYLRHPGRYQFLVEPAMQYEDAPTTPIEVSIGRDTTLTIRVGGFRVTGVVKRDAGLAFRNAQVTAFGASGLHRATSDMNGEFQMLLPAGKYSWIVEPADKDVQIWRGSDSTQIRGADRVNLTLHTALLSGRVLDTRTGNPVDSMHVWLTERGVAEPVADSVTARDGKFHFFVRKGSRFQLAFEDERPLAIREHKVSSGWGMDVAMETAKRFEDAKVSEFAVPRDTTFDVYVKAAGR